MSRDINIRVNKSVIYIVASVILLLIGVLTYIYAVQNISQKQNNEVSTLDEGKQVSSINNAYAGIPENDIQHIKSEGDVSWNLQDPYYFYKTSPIVALVHIDTINGARNHDPVSGEAVYPQTIGRMTIQKIYKGDVKTGEQLNYSRMGGDTSV